VIPNQLPYLKMKSFLLCILFILGFVFLIHAQESGFITGILKDKLTTGPLFGVKLTAGGHVARTNEDGFYELSLPAGTYNILMTRYGLDELAIEGCLIPAHDTVVLDTSLTPVAVPLAGVNATLEWEYAIVAGTPSGPSLYEKSNDNGVLTDLFTFQEAGSQVAVKFDNSDNHIIGGRIFVGDGSFPGPFLGTDVLIRVYDDEGMEGLPGNVLYEDTVTVDQYGWVGFDGLDALAQTEHYYLAMVQLNDAPDCVPVGCAQYPANSSSLMKIGSYNWEPFPLGNAMIRAWVAAPHDSLHVTNYRIARYSGFDPNEGNPQSGSLTELASSSYPYYTDNTIVYYPAICYAYGIKALYNNGMYSPYRVSNIIYKTPPFNVSLAVGQSDSSAMGITRIMFTGQDWPFNNYSSFFQSPGTVSFPSVSRSKYQVSVYKPGYEKIILDSIEIISDSLFECLLNEEIYPLKDLQVNAFTGILTWNLENISLFDCSCSDDSLCHEVTTPELDLTCANQWIMSVVYRYPTNYDPAFVEYSTDEGRTWADFYQFSTTDTWDTVQLDLSDFSGIQGKTAIKFQVHDLHGAPYYLDISRVKVWSPDLIAHPEEYLVTLNGLQVGTTDTCSYQFLSLVNGQTYRAGVNALYSTGLTDTVFTTFTYHQLFPPENLAAIEDLDTIRLSWSPPSGSWDTGKATYGYPDSMTGYILKYESNNIYLEFPIDNPWDTTYNLVKPNCDTAYISVTAVYDLSDYGYPGENIESIPDGPLVFNNTGPIEDEFFEDWSSMNFYRNCWNVGGNGISVVAGEGNPGPALVYLNPPAHYQVYLTSNPISITRSNDATLFIEFDLNLFCGGQSGYEIMEFQVNQYGSESWDMIQGISNSLGNIDWLHFKVDLSEFVETDLFRFRMKFAGIGAEPVRWKIDNIHVYNYCAGPVAFNADLVSDSEVYLRWSQPTGAGSSRNLSSWSIYRQSGEQEFSLLAESTDSTYSDILSNSGQYCYKVSAVYNDNGIICESPVSDTSCIISYLGYKDNHTEKNIRIYPNPAKDHLMISCADENIQSLVIYNSIGLIKKLNIEKSHEIILNLNDLAPGIYFIRVNFENDYLLEKFIHLE
jgi:hypothetical protein